MCGKCQDKNPPDAVGDTVPWIMCDKYCGWFHQTCVAVVSADVQGSWFCNTCLGKSLCQLCFLNDAVTNGEIVQDVQWIECSGCRNWFHTICVGAKADALQTWFCSVCSH